MYSTHQPQRCPTPPLPRRIDQGRGVGDGGDVTEAASLAVLMDSVQPTRTSHEDLHEAMGVRYSYHP